MQDNAASHNNHLPVLRSYWSFKTSYWEFQNELLEFQIELLEFQKRVIEILNRVMGVSNKVIGISNRVIALSNWVVIEDIVEFNKTKGNGSKQVPAKVCVSREWVTRRQLLPYAIVHPGNHLR